MRSSRARALRLALLAAALLPGAACSPVYVLKAGWAEAKILRARQPFAEVIRDPSTDPRLRGKLSLAREARRFAMDDLGLDVGDSYTSYAELESDTLAMVLSAAHRDRFESRTWWFPIVGRVPYRGFFDLDDALSEQRKLEAEGYDTHLRPTSAFSTLGWFSDPLLSTTARYDEVELVATIIHELSHNHLFVPGRVRFNESYATWVGRTGAVSFFCSRPGGGPGAVWCDRARQRWEDTMLFSRFIDGLVDDLAAVYADTAVSSADRIAARQPVFDGALERFRTEVQPAFGALTFAGFASAPLNNATLLGRMRYYHRLPDFDALLAAHCGSVKEAVASLRTRVEAEDDPFAALPAADAPQRAGTPPRGPPPRAEPPAPARPPCAEAPPRGPPPCAEAPPPPECADAVSLG